MIKLQFGDSKLLIARALVHKTKLTYHRRHHHHYRRRPESRLGRISLERITGDGLVRAGVGLVVSCESRAHI